MPLLLLLGGGPQEVTLGSATSTPVATGLNPLPHTPQVVTLGSATSLPQVRGFHTRQAGSWDPVVAQLRTTVWSGTRDWAGTPGDLGELVGELVEVGGRTFQDTLSDTGSGSLEAQLSDPVADLVRPGHLIRWELPDRAVFTSLVEQRQRTSVSPREEAGATVKLAGRGSAAVLARARVWPALGITSTPASDRRVWNYASPDLPYVDLWPLAQDTHQADPDSRPPGDARYYWPESWVDTLAHWVWTRRIYYPGVDPLTWYTRWVDPGTSYLRRTFTVSASAGRDVEVWAAADDTYEVWLDGVKVLDDQDAGAWYRGQCKHTSRLHLSQGTHVLAAKVSNVNYAAAGLLCSVLPVLGEGSYDVPIVHTDTAWRILGYPILPPGWTPGAIMQRLVQEAQDRGCLPYLRLGFNAFLDSNGRPWDVLTEFTTQVGQDLLQVLDALADYGADWEMAPGELELRMYRKGEAGGATTVSLDVGEELVELVHREQVQ